MAARNELRGHPYELIPYRIAGAGDHTLRALVATAHIVVVRLSLYVDGASAVKFMSGSDTAGNEISGILVDGAASGVREYRAKDLEYGLFWTDKGAPLILNHSAGLVNANGHAMIVLVPEMPVIAEVKI